ncbi:MAG: TIGR04211 family SH3 domain-containing protein [Pseudomonadales bacterium]|nr:TIGR04211 family SH3 domain-containing protein [Pseudomonadales bacterium]
MKQFCLAAMILLLTQTSVAKDAPTILEIRNPTIGNIHFIRDVIKVPVRSGASNQHRIVHRGLKSGATITLLAIDKEAGFAKIKTQKGLEGWIPSQYVIAEPTSAIKLAKAYKTIAKLKQKAGPMGEQLLLAQKENQKLSNDLTQLNSQKDQLSKEYQRLKDVSANAVALDIENKRLLNSNEGFKNKHDTLAAENQRLQTQLRNDGFINGALVLFAGMILTLFVQYFKQTRKRSEWG